MYFHTEVLNRLIKQHGCKSYLEIGVGDPSNNYFLIECENKECIDPIYKNDDSSYVSGGVLVNALPDLESCVTYKMTSDEAFEIIPEDKKYDCIFIDGLHTEEQSGRDLLNAFKHVSENGFIVLHDTNPTKEWQQTETPSEQYYQWNGTVWKTVAKLRDCNVCFYTSPYDFGITIIKHTGSERLPEVFLKSDLTWDDFVSRSEYLLNIENKYPVLDVAICCIAKMENLYLRDFIEYHMNLGVKKFFLYDNNEENGEYPQQVIGDYIRKGMVVYKNVRGKHRCQLECYTECYNEHKMEYDWIAFIDIDEYIKLYEDDTLQEFLLKNRFKDVCALFLYWVQFGDSGLLHYDNRPVYKRFTEHIDQTKNRANTFKILLRGKINVTVLFEDANAVSFDNPDRIRFVISDAAGREIGPYMGYTQWSYDCAALNHYQTLTIDEFLCRRFGRRSYADKASSFNQDVIMGIFWQLNEWTEEKQRIIDDFLGTYEMKEDNV